MTLMTASSPNLPVLLGHHVEVWLFFTTNGRLRNLVVVIIIELHIFNFIRNLKSKVEKNYKTKSKCLWTLIGETCLFTPIGTPGTDASAGPMEPQQHTDAPLAKFIL